MAATNKFDLTQTYFLFNWISNASADTDASAQDLADQTWNSLNGTSSSSLLKTYGAGLSGGDWDVTWGPGVYENPNDDEADNTAFVVYSKSLNTYVLAIAGTNPKAKLDFKLEDSLNKDNPMVSWDNFDPSSEAAPVAVSSDTSTRQITAGFALGSWLLCNSLVQTTLNPINKGQKLGDYLKGIDFSSGANVVVTGHSLGGALTMVMAQWIQDLAGEKYQSQVSAMPSAGPSPGNSAFQSQWDSNFPTKEVVPASGPDSKNQVKSINMNVVCDKDLVPRAYQNIYIDGTDSAFYLQNTSGGLISPIATFNDLDIVVKEGLIYEASKVQNLATEFALTQTQHPLVFAAPSTFQYKSGKTTGQQKSDIGTDPSISAFKNAVFHIHVWTYGPVAFDIDFSVFKALSVD